MTAALALIMTAQTVSADGLTDIAIRKDDKTLVSLKVEIAATPEEQAQGLMYRDKLEQGRGMLFVYDTPTRRAFWMKNTLIPLDMLFFDRKGRLVYIHPNAKPLSLAPVGPESNDVCTVLEIAGGEAKRLGISVGNKLIADIALHCLP